MGSKEVFISYKSDEFDDALWVKDNLEANGISCWMAPMCITGGASYAAEIPAAIQNAEIVVLILSTKAQESQWIPRELDQAINLDKLIMPFTIENCQLTDEFNFYLSNVQRYFAFVDREATFAKMLQDIKNYLGKKDPEPPLEPESDSKAKPKVTETDDTPKTDPVLGPIAIPTNKKDTLPEKKSEDKKKEKSTAKKSKKPLIIALTAVVCVVALIAGTIFFTKMSNEVVIADNVYNVSDYTINIEGKDITADDMKEFARFEDLNMLRFKNCNFKTNDLSVLATKPLVVLEFENCNLTDTQLGSIDFNSLEGLTTLNLSGNSAIKNPEIIAPIADTLKNLNINGITCSSNIWIKDFTGLEELYIDATGITDLSFADQMVYLKTFSANNNGITTLAGLDNTTILEEVYLANNKLSDVSLLVASAAKLRILNLDNNNIENLKYLNKCTAMKMFSAAGNKLSSVDFSSDWNELTHFYISNNKISSLLFFSKSTNLINVDFSKNKVVSLSGLTFKENEYITADFSHNEIFTVDLPANCHYSKLLLHSNAISNSSFLSKIKGSSISLDYFENIHTPTLKAADFFELYIVDCPANRRVELEELSFNIKLVSASEAEKAILN